MSEARAGAIADRFEVRATAADHFAWLRTRLALERTLMSWVRTAVSLTGFGIAILQFPIGCKRCSGSSPQFFRRRRDIWGWR